MSQASSGCGRQKCFWDINHIIWTEVQPACLRASPAEVAIKKLFFSLPGRKNHVLIEKLCYLMLWNYKSDE